jgi:dTDP-4-amino-4,6-dideoxygalactose transaminase
MHRWASRLPISPLRDASAWRDSVVSSGRCRYHCRCRPFTTTQYCDRLAIDGGRPVVDPTAPLPTIANSSGRSLGAEELARLTEVIDSGSLGYITGTQTKALQDSFGAVYGTPHNVAVNSGTSSLHTALVYLNPEPGDEIICSPITDMGQIIAILMQLCVPVFVDIDPLTQNIDTTKIKAAVSPRTRGIVVTHIYGSPADMDPIMDIAAEHDLCVIEDCAQALLAYYKGRLCGTIGHIGCFSFQQSKHLTTGDGGMVITNDTHGARYGRQLALCHDKGWPRDGISRAVEEGEVVVFGSRDHVRRHTYYKYAHVHVHVMHAYTHACCAGRSDQVCDQACT